MLHNSIGFGIGPVSSIARGQYYWILGALFGIVLTLVWSVPGNMYAKYEVHCLRLFLKIIAQQQEAEEQEQQDEYLVATQD